MQGTFYKAICQVGIFMICAQAIIHFRPNRSYEKYLKLLVSVMILIQIFQPVSRLLGGKGKEGLADRVEWFREQLEESMEQAAGSASASQQLLEEMTLAQVQEQLAKERAAREMSLQSDLEPMGDTFGTKDESDVSLEEQSNLNSPEESGIAVEPIEKVEPVKIE